MPPRRVTAGLIAMLAVLLAAVGVAGAAVVGATQAGQPGGGPIPPAPLQAHLQLIPQSLHAVLAHGLALAVSTNEPSDGLATLMIGRRAARRAHLARRGSGPVVIGRGTISLAAGARVLHIHVPARAARRLRRLLHAEFKVRLTLVGRDRSHVSVVAVGRY